MHLIEGTVYDEGNYKHTPPGDDLTRNPKGYASKNEQEDDENC